MKPRSLRDIAGEIGIKRRAFDVIGDIAILELPEIGEEKEKLIAEELLKSHKNIRAVFKKASRVEGEERVRKLKHLAGEKRTLTLHKEHGCIFRLDIAKVYFSPRLSFERKRVASNIKESDVVVDLFAGIGSFSIIIAKHAKARVYAIDINEHAYNFLRENIKLNKVEDKVTPVLGDCREAAPRNIATHVIMNLPLKAHEFFDVALQALRSNETGIIHFYTIAKEEELGERIKFLENTAKSEKREISVIFKRKIRSYATRVYNFAIDIEAEPI